MRRTYSIGCLTLGVLLSLTTIGRAEHLARPVQPDQKSLSHRLWNYIPNRMLDFLDIFRCRVRVGPGLAADANVTSYAANFIGQYRAFYVGLPGPRMAPILPPLAGKEQWKGLMVMGVDATDDSPHPPGYTDSECNLGGHVLVAGLDLGFDPIEIGDFLGGFFMKDVRRDDR